MRNIVVGSAFRNAAGRQVTRWLGQVTALRDHLKDDYVRALAVEGDSTDATRLQLTQGADKRNLVLDLLTCNHGGPVFGSTEAPERMKALAKVGTAILNGVAEGDDILVYVESDLIWDPYTISEMIDMVDVDRETVIAPLVFAGANFYDVWAFRKNGSRFAPFPPYHEGLHPNGLTEVDSAGSCLVMPALAALEVKFTDECLVGWCGNARAAGYRIFASADHIVRHPA